MKPPAAIDIGVHRLGVLADDTGLVGQHSATRGSTHPEALTIALDVRNPATIQQETLVHEILHACWDQTALKAHTVEEHQELVVTALAPLVLDVIRRNPDLVSYLRA